MFTNPLNVIRGLIVFVFLYLAFVLQLLLICTPSAKQRLVCKNICAASGAKSETNGNAFLFWQNHDAECTCVTRSPAVVIDRQGMRK